jgi:hypothetical protein
VRACCGPCGLARPASPGGSTTCTDAADRHAALTDADATVIECADAYTDADCHAAPNRNADTYACIANRDSAVISTDAD